MFLSSYCHLLTIIKCFATKSIRIFIFKVKWVVFKFASRKLVIRHGSMQSCKVNEVIFGRFVHLINRLMVFMAFHEIVL